MPKPIETAPRINTVVSERTKKPNLVFSTSNRNKLEEIARMMGVPVEQVLGPERKLDIDEIQADTPEEVAIAKAREGRRLNDNQGVIVEDTSLSFDAAGGLPGVFANQFTRTPEMKRFWCEYARKTDDQRAEARVMFAYDTGQDVIIWPGTVYGKIADQPRGSGGFGWDDMFIPDGQEQLPNWDGVERTYAELCEINPDFKDQLSPRRIALQSLSENPPEDPNWIYQLPEPYQLQLESMRMEELERGERALRFAYDLEVIRGNEPNSELTVAEFPPYQELPIGKGHVQRIVPGADSPSLGLIITPWDKARDMNGKPKRLDLDANDEPILWQMGPEATKMALAARLVEYQTHHSPRMYELIRGIDSGRIPIAERPGVPSDVMDLLLKITRETEAQIKAGEARDEQDHIITDLDAETVLDRAWGKVEQILGTAATKELGYARMSSDEDMSRTEAGTYGLFVKSGGVPTSLFALGGMPPVTGWKDVLVTSAMSYMRSYIPHNSIYADNPQMQLRLFEAARESIYGFELDDDIEDIVLRQIGVSVGCINPKQIAEDMQALYDARCRSFRIYTTNPDSRIINTAYELRQRFPDAHICVGPFVDIPQALKLTQPDIDVNTLLAGHGGGENCTSLEAGGAANGLELTYLMYLDPRFRRVAIGLEGGTGSSIGPLLGMLDVISMNQRGVAGGIETGGLFAQHANKIIVQPYPGSASAVTQQIEAEANAMTAMRRRDPAGRLKQVEGKPNYMKKDRSKNSVVDAWLSQRMLAGRALADQRSLSISQLRRNIAAYGHGNHRVVTSDAYVIANAHRGH